MRIDTRAALLSLALATASLPALALTDPKVGGAAMYPSKDIVDNAVNSKDHTTLVAAVKAAGLVDTLKSPGPSTLFATLTKILTYHVVPGRITAADLMRMIRAGHGSATLKTVSGGELTAKMAGKGITLTDEKGDVAHVTIANVYQSNGVIHVIDTVMLPG